MTIHNSLREILTTEVDVERLSRFGPFGTIWNEMGQFRPVNDNLVKD